MLYMYVYIYIYKYITLTLSLLMVVLLPLPNSYTTLFQGDREELVRAAILPLASGLRCSFSVPLA